MNEGKSQKKIFRYNMSFYYQSTIIYFVVFILYTIVRGEFVENSFRLITKDPIIYFFAIIVCISLISLLYNLFQKRHIELSEKELTFAKRNKQRTFTIDEISKIKISRPRKQRNKAFRLIRIKVKSRRRPILVRPSDYENKNEMIESFQKLKENLENS